MFFKPGHFTSDPKERFPALLGVCSKLFSVLQGQVTRTKAEVIICLPLSERSSCSSLSKTLFLGILCLGKGGGLGSLITINTRDRYKAGFQQHCLLPGGRRYKSSPGATASLGMVLIFFPTAFLKDQDASAPASCRKSELFSGSSFSSPGEKNACSYMALANTE